MAESDRSVQVNLRLPASLKEAAEKAAIADHRSLTSLVEKLLADHLTARPKLEDWHERAQTRLVGIIADKCPQFSKFGLFTRSYAIESASAKSRNPATLIGHLQFLHNELSNFLPSPAFIYPYTRPELSSYFTFDPGLARGISSEILESVALPEIVGRPELWRASPNGLFSDVRGYTEDFFHSSDSRLKPGKWFSPLFMTRALYALIQHAYLFSENYPTGTMIEFRCEWSGLLERELKDHDPMVDWLPGKIAHVNRRITTGEWPLEEVRMQWPEIASELAGPVMRLFDPTFDYTAGWIRGQLQRLLRP